MQPSMVSSWFHMMLGGETWAQGSSLASDLLFTMAAQISTKTPLDDEFLIR